jgi:hypothetical protein
VVHFLCSFPYFGEEDQGLYASIARSFRDEEEKLAASIADRQGLGVSRRQTSKM